MREGGRWVGSERRGGLDGAVAEVAEIDEVVLVVDAVQLQVHANLFIPSSSFPVSQVGVDRESKGRKGNAP